MRRLERDPLLDMPAGFDDPLEMLMGCHRRIEKQLDTLRRLRAHVEEKGVDAEASAAAGSMLRYFGNAAADHRILEAAWQRLRKPLEGIAEGLGRSLPPADVQAFVDGCTHHILTEENTLREFFDRWLGDDDHRALVGGG